MVIYLDVLLLTNLWMDYAILRTTASITHSPFHPLRCGIASFLGALSALIIFLPPLPLLLCIGIRFGIAILLCGVAFGCSHIKGLLQQSTFFLLISILFCGGASAVVSLLNPIGSYANNTVLYTDISLLTLLFGSTLAAAISSFFARHSARNADCSYRIQLQIQGNVFQLPALADSGNHLRDAYTGKPVAVCPASAVQAWLKAYPDAIAAAATCKSFRLLPVKSVTGQKLLPVFQPDSAILYAASNQHNRQAVDILIAISEEISADTPAIIPAYVIARNYKISV